MDEQTELLREMRDLLRLIAEPALAKRDERLRNALKEVAGRGKTKSKAVSLMDGTRTRSAIQAEAKMDQGNLSRLVKALREQGLIVGDDQPKLTIAIPANFFDGAGEL